MRNFNKVLSLLKKITKKYCRNKTKSMIEYDYDKDSTYNLVHRADKKNALEKVMFKMEKYHPKYNTTSICSLEESEIIKFETTSKK